MAEAQRLRNKLHHDRLWVAPAFGGKHKQGAWIRDLVPEHLFICSYCGHTMKVDDKVCHITGCKCLRHRAD